MTFLSRDVHLPKPRIAAFLYLVVLSLSPLFFVRENSCQISASETTKNASTDSFESTQKTEDNNALKLTDNNDDQLEWFRLIREGDVPVKLETGIVRYAGTFKYAADVQSEATVDLIGTIHFAEREYYEELNRLFQEYDAVIFELVAPRGADVVQTLKEEREKKTKLSLNPLNIVPLFQKKLGDALGFVYQIDGIDYSAPNLVRGDMDMEEFISQLIISGDVLRFCTDALWGCFLPTDSSDLLGAALIWASSNDSRLVGRRLFALELENATELENQIWKTKQGKDNVLIGMRNNKALDKMSQEMSRGKTKFAIFYGSAHLPDLALRLEKIWGLKRDPQTKWLTAWSMEKDAKK